MEPMHEESAMEYVWQEGDIVWAKITGHPWWPALVTQVPSLPDDHIRVDFFADNSQYASPYSAPSFLPANSPHTKSSGSRSTCTDIWCGD